MGHFYRDLSREAVSGLARRLRELRFERDISQRQVADAVGVDSSLISALENGRRDGKLSTWTAVARGLGYRLKIEFEDVLCEEGEDVMIDERERREENRREGLCTGKRRFY